MDVLAARGRQVLADVVGADRQLAVAAVGEHGELHARRAAVVEQRLDRGADGAAGEEHVVDDHDRQPGDVEVDVRGVQDGRVGPRGDVVAVEADVEVAERDLRVEQLAEQRLQAPARKAPRRWMPTSAGAGSPGLRSTISCAMRVSARRTSSSSRTTFSLASIAFLPGLSGPG